VAIQGFAFSPSPITIFAGQSVTWTNEDPVSHTVTADDNSFTSLALATGATYSHTFAAPGTYTYHCAIHPFMHGTVLVIPATASSTPTSTATHTPTDTPTATNTSVPSTDTATNTPGNTTAPTDTPTAVPSPTVTSTNTAVPVTQTLTPSATPATATATSPTGPASGWSKFRRDAHDDGQAGVPLQLSSPLGIRFTLNVSGGSLTSSPVLGPNGTLYQVDDQGSLNAYHVSNGALIWTSQPVLGTNVLSLGNPAPFKLYFTSTPAVAADGTIYAAGQDNYGTDTAGGLWKFDPATGTATAILAQGWYLGSSPAIGPDGTIYAGSIDGVVYAVKPNGTLVYQSAPPTCSGGQAPLIQGSPALDSGGNLYVGYGCAGDTTGGLHGGVLKVSPTGAVLWQVESPAGSAQVKGGEVSTAVVLSSDGSTLYAEDIQGHVFAVQTGSGTIAWTFKLAGGVGVGTQGTVASPALSPDGGTLYVAFLPDSRDGINALYALNASNGQVVGQAGAAQINASPAVDANGNVVVASTAGLAAYSPNLQSQYFSQSYSPYSTEGGPTIGADGTIYLSNTGGQVLALIAPTETQTPTGTSVPPTNTSTPIPATNTVAPTATFTVAPPSATSTPTATATPVTNTATGTPATSTAIGTASATHRPTGTSVPPTNTSTPIPATNTVAPAPSATFTVVAPSATSTPVPTSTPTGVPTCVVPLAIQVPRTVRGGGLLPFRVTTAPGSRVSGVLSVHGRTLGLFAGIADKHGRFADAISIPIRPTRRVRAEMKVRNSLACGSAAGSRQVDILPGGPPAPSREVSLTVARLAGGMRLAITVPTAGKESVVAEVRVLERKKAGAGTVLFQARLHGRADKRGRLTLSVRVVYRQHLPARAAKLTVTVRILSGRVLGALKVQLLR
jgi:outer membrane protein assembly factor BamB